MVYDYLFLYNIITCKENNKMTVNAIGIVKMLILLDHFCPSHSLPPLLLAFIVLDWAEAAAADLTHMNLSNWRNNDVPVHFRR
jgi:hypothetical protein